MADLRKVATDHYRQRRSLATAAAQVATREWRAAAASATTEAELAEAWAQALPRVATVVSGAQLAAAQTADAYITAALAAQGVSPTAEGQTVASALAGVASDGRPLASLLYQPAQAQVTTVRSRRQVGASRARAAGQASLDMIVRTQVADAGRAADQVAMVARRQATGYVRMLVGSSCSRCVILAGRRYKINAGFNRHPRCLPAGVTVSGPATLAATRRWYQGELVILTTASGQELPVTGNHPVLTDRGWLPANLVEEGDNVVRSVRAQGATPLSVPGEHQVPARIEDLWRPNGMVPLLHVPTSAEDFHGDGGHGEVDVVLTDRLLRNGLKPAGRQLIEQEQLAGRVAQPALFAQYGAAQQMLFGLAGSANGIMGSGSLPEALIGSHSAGAHLAGRGHVADFDAGSLEPTADHVAADAVAAAEAVLAFAGRVRRREVGDWQSKLAARWDAPAAPFTVESRGAYAERGQDLLLRLTGQVELDRVVERRRVEWSGHVYNLTSIEGWYSANGLIVSNCDCIHVPAREDLADEIRTNPRAYFDSLTREEQDRAFTNAGAQAIRDGADIAQVVNARRGALGLAPAGRRLTQAEIDALRGGRQRGRLQTVDVYGQQLYTTTEGATRLGLAGRRLGAGQSRRQRPPRLMPESIYQIAGDDRDEALRLLRRYGYLL